MRRITLTEFAAEKGQTISASLLGMSQGALNKALRVGRDIYVTEHADGSFAAEETRPFPCQAQFKKFA
ncbi:Cro/CI family transcriptional regulator [Pseudomonas sp. CCI3.2]|uniref:Cro/CI family transcriptional regulator n=1 Tax=unclassified Pseudomonas TaxID=196821 RepID=UPI002B2311F2|nr:MULTISPECIES: Cro/CI family transcriptional regulator [unclassified Pseudomonas]MEB0078043.1 Cro/CI family transcriptional regulator [Pseudomonas sp. MH10out]MEB0104050.1 Cro/CI family transcriptional regulator [Pseudomonas sp. CCI3.2]